MPREFRLHPSQSLGAHFARIVSSPTYGSIEELYAAVYARYFGPRRFRRFTPASDVAFSRMLATCFAHDIDPEDFIAANMHALLDWCRRRSVRFQPTMLGTDKALERYNDVAAAANKSRARCSEAFFGRTSIGQLRPTLRSDEEAVGIAYVAAVLDRDRHAWESALRETDPSAWWRAIEATRGPEYRNIILEHGTETIENEKRDALVCAAFSVAQSYGDELPEWIILRRISWPLVAEEIADFIPAKATAYSLVDVKRIAGSVWPR